MCIVLMGHDVHTPGIAPLGTVHASLVRVVQQVAGVVRLGPLNRTVGGPYMQSFITLAKMHV